MIELSGLNIAETPPKKGDLLVIETKAVKGVRVLAQAKGVISGRDGVEIIVSTTQNKFFNWNMYYKGESWVWKVWNLGQVSLTSSTNSMTSLGAF